MGQKRPRTERPLTLLGVVGDVLGGEDLATDADKRRQVGQIGAGGGVQLDDLLTFLLEIVGNIGGAGGESGRRRRKEDESEGDHDGRMHGEYCGDLRRWKAADDSIASQRSSTAAVKLPNECVMSGFIGDRKRALGLKTPVRLPSRVSGRPELG